MMIDWQPIFYLHLKLFLQEVNMEYQEWMLDDHTLDIRFKDKAVVINQKEQVVDSWRIFPLSSPPEVC